MARKLRLQFEGAIYHVTIRGNGRRKIFVDDRDRDRFLWRLVESADTYEIRLYLYCLMDNHCHLLVETPRANISRYMQSLLTGYTVYFNLRHNTSGHLLQGRYGAQLVEGDNYLLSLSRYIHLNPVHIKAMKEMSLKQKAQYLRSYQWSSYRGYIDKRRRSEQIEYGPILELMHGPKKEQAARYRKFVEGGLARTNEEFVKLMKTKPRGIGDKIFRKWVDAEYTKLREEQGSKEDVSFRREAVLKDADEVVKIVAKAFGVNLDDMQRPLRRNLARPAAAQMLCKYVGLTQREAGRKLGYGTGSAVSRQISRLRETLNCDKKLSRILNKAEKKVLALS